MTTGVTVDELLSMEILLLGANHGAPINVPVKSEKYL